MTLEETRDRILVVADQALDAIIARDVIAAGTQLYELQSLVQLLFDGADAAIVDRTKEKLKQIFSAYDSDSEFASWAKETFQFALSVWRP